MPRKAQNYNIMEMHIKCTKEYEDCDPEGAALARQFMAQQVEIESHRKPRKSRAKTKENNSPNNQ